jgi:hypothetical protein
MADRPPLEDDGLCGEEKAAYQKMVGATVERIERSLPFRRDADQPDQLRAAGATGLRAAASSYSSTQGISFLTYARFMVRRAILARLLATGDPTWDLGGLGVALSALTSRADDSGPRSLLPEASSDEPAKWPGNARIELGVGFPPGQKKGRS